MVNWISRVNLIWVFILLFVFHSLLYYSFGNPRWYLVALTATLVDTAIFAALQLLLAESRKQKGK